ncbi:MAG: DUF2203 domain-containing protein [Candidatus Rokubacteria bacterium]|nr:DUF2203 domain-containing protein [Candidatus Rokubacteria bacterium]MBI3104679.1 DUF2203 domain-containing protein [Candidatus Rokubacteria bacterium]
MSDRYFTAAEVDALIPRLSALMGRAMERHRQASSFAHALNEEKERIRLSGGGLVDRREWKARAERLDGLTIEVRAAVKTIAALGGTVKDLEQGLVDFPGRLPQVAGAAPVNLCWKHGEDAVRFWHGMDEGYGQRKPLP